VRIRKRLRRSAPTLYQAAVRAYRLVERALGALTATVHLLVLSATRRSRSAHAIAARPDLRVVLDGCIFQERPFGIARLWRAIMAEWSESGFSKSVVVLDRGGTAPRFPGFEYRRTPRLRAHDSITQRRMLEAVCRAEAADLAVSTWYTCPTKTRSLLYVYDMTPEIGEWNLDEPIWREKAAAIAHASAYACLSQNTLNDLVTEFPEAANKPNTLVLPGVEASFVPASQAKIAELASRLALPANYYLFIGYRDAYKNADLLFEALPLLHDTEDFGVLLIGGAPQLEPGFALLAGNVTVRLASLSDDELRAAYTGAAALLYLSRYEGFGLPILEAMACGCPVITCRNSSLPEAAGDAAIYVDADDPHALREAMLRVREPRAREALIASGHERARMFRWPQAATILGGAIEAAAKSGESSQ